SEPSNGRRGSRWPWRAGSTARSCASLHHASRGFAVALLHEPVGLLLEPVGSKGELLSPGRLVGRWAHLAQLGGRDDRDPDTTGTALGDDRVRRARRIVPRGAAAADELRLRHWPQDLEWRD